MKRRSVVAIPLFVFLLSAFVAAPLAVPGDVCDLWVTSMATDPPSWIPSCDGSCSPGGCQAPVQVQGSGVTRWWCDCNGVRSGEDALCEAVLIYDSQFPDDPWEARCYQARCRSACEDRPPFPPEPVSMILCPCF
jgi:hypothetical protein